MDDLLLAVPVTRDLPCVLDAAAVKRAAAQKAEIESTGAEVVRVHIAAPDQPLRFFIRFQVGKQSFEVRGKLEALRYDVGQKLSDKELFFYAVKRVTESKGWND